jgi:hypothetical protein
MSTRNLLDRFMAIEERKKISVHTPLKEIADKYNLERGASAIDTKEVDVDSRRDHISKAYDRMKHDPQHPKVKAAYDALKTDIVSQWNHLAKHGYTMSMHKDDPYKDHHEMLKDIHENKHIKVWAHNGDMPDDHPLNIRDTGTGHHMNSLFRAVHDVIGHGVSNHDFTERGEENAWKHHAQMFSKEALPALTTETKGQSSVYGHRHTLGKKKLFPKQKAGILPLKFHGRIDESLGAAWWAEFELQEKETPRMAGSRDFVKKMSDLLVMTEKKLVRKEGTLMESLHLGGDQIQPTRDEASRTGLGRLALDMEPSFDTDAGGHDERGTEGEIPKHVPESEEDKYSGQTVVKEGERKRYSLIGKSVNESDPKPDHGETAMGTQDPMGKDEPVHDQPYETGTQDGMVVPPDRRGSYDDTFFKKFSNSEIVKEWREGVLADVKEMLGEGATDKDILFSFISLGASVEEAYDFMYGSVPDEPEVTSESYEFMTEAIRKRINRAGTAGARTKQFREALDELGDTKVDCVGNKCNNQVATPRPSGYCSTGCEADHLQGDSNQCRMCGKEADQLNGPQKVCNDCADTHYN